MSEQNNGGPAFPVERDLKSGMTIRDYFAAKALQGLMVGEITIPELHGSAFENLTKAAYMISDSMLKSREE